MIKQNPKEGHWGHKLDLEIGLNRLQPLHLLHIQLDDKLQTEPKAYFMPLMSNSTCSQPVTKVLVQMLNYYLQYFEVNLKNLKNIIFELMVSSYKFKLLSHDSHELE